MTARLWLAMLAGLAVAGLSLTTPGAAQDWPMRPVKIMIPFGPGSTPDLVGRLIADRLQQKLGQPFVVEDKPGASGNTGTDAVAKADPDGYTLGISIGGPLAINPLLFSKMPYDPKTDLATVTMIATQPSALAVNAKLGVNSVAELIALLKKNPGKYNFGSGQPCNAHRTPPAGSNSDSWRSSSRLRNGVVWRKRLSISRFHNRSCRRRSRTWKMRSACVFLIAPHRASSRRSMAAHCSSGASRSWMI
jgi:hypothetical protein